MTTKFNCLWRYGLLASALLLVVTATNAQRKQPPATLVNLNAATVEQLQQVPGIGPGTAKAIVNFRQKSGPFQKVEDLLAIKGISKARFEKMRPYLTIGSTTRNSP